MEVDELVCILGISKNGIDFNSPDGQLCHLILMTLSPNEDPSEHRKFITRFRTMCNNPDIRFNILDAPQNNNIIDIIQKWEENGAQTDDIS
jgi:PTS system fructose-specific IIC component